MTVHSLPGGRLIVADVLAGLALLPDESVQCVVTSPPYWGLRDYGVEGQLGSEPTPEAFVANMVAVFREVRRVLRADGTLWLNLGDSYTGNPGGYQGKNGERASRTFTAKIDLPKRGPGLKPKDLVGIPWMVAFALRADGWYLRQECVWAKPNPMPESVRDRCVKSHESLFLLAKSPRYFFDLDGIKEKAVGGTPGNKSHRGATAYANGDGKMRTKVGLAAMKAVTERIKRSVWRVSTQPYKGAHFATFPPKLIEPCVLAGTSPAGCCESCGAPLIRQTEKRRVATRSPKSSKVPSGWETGPGSHGNFHREGRASAHDSSPYVVQKIAGNRDPLRHTTTTVTVGWISRCECDSTAVPCVVLDPFMGSGTTAQVALEHGRRWVGIDLDPRNVDLVRERLAKVQPRLALETA